MNTCQIASLLTIIALASSKAATTIYDFEGASVPSAFSLTGNGGAFSQSLTSSNAYAGSQALSLDLTCTGGSQWATTMITLPDLVQHVTFSIYDQYASSSPVYYYFFLQDSHDVPLTTIYGLDYADSGFGYPKSTSVLMFGSNTIPDYTRTIGWHVIDATISTTSIEYKIDGAFLGSMATDPSIKIDMVGFGIANAGNPGTNALLIDNLSISTIPEPSSSIIGWVAICGLVFKRTRFQSLNHPN